MEITKREILFSTIIVSLMVGLGVWIENPIVSNATKESLRTASSVQIKDSEKFGYIARTNVGPFIAEGELVANDTIMISDIPGQFSVIKKVKEVYTEHVEVYTTTDSKGHTQTHTRTYHSWDVKGKEVFETGDYTFLGKKFTARDIDYHYREKLDTIIYHRKFWGDDVRYCYYTAPITVEGVLFGSAENKGYTNLNFHEGATIQAVVDDAEGWVHIAPILFWVLWLLLTACFVYLFYYCENHWLY